MPNKYFVAEDHLVSDGDTADQEDINAPLRALETAFDVTETDIEAMSAILLNYEDAAASAAAALASAAAASGSAATATSAAATATSAKDMALQAEADTLSIFGDAQDVADAVALSTANAAATAADVLATAADVLATADDALATAADRAAVEATLSGANLDGKADKSGTLAQFAATTSLELKGVISDETGSGALVFADSPVLSGNPEATTQAVTDDSKRIATTEFVSDCFPHLLGANGYQKFKNGITIQWGVTPSNEVAGAPASVTFPIPFTTVYQLVATPISSLPTVVSAWSGGLSNTGVSLRINIDGVWNIRWIAIGFITPA